MKTTTGSKLSSRRGNERKKYQAQEEEELARQESEEYQEAVGIMARTILSYRFHSGNDFAEEISSRTAHDLARELLQQTYPDSKMLVLAVRARNQEVPQRGINICANCWIQTQNDMLRKSWIREVEE